MQTEITTSNTTSVHIKAAYDNEFRRFLLTPVTFQQLESTLKTLFNLNVDVRVKFQDDENDWVLLTTDQELSYATELSGSPLRLQVSLLPESTTAENNAGKRGGKGCRGRGLGRGGCKSPEERLTAKSSRLATRITQLEEKLNSEQLTADRERVIRWRLLMLQDKLAAVKNRKESFANPETPTETVAVPEPVSTENEMEEEKPSFRGGRRGRGCGRGGWRKARMDGDGTDRPVRFRKHPIAPEIIEHLRQCKTNLRAARASGDVEKIQACQEALRSAKDAKFVARAALRAQASANEEKL
jgi:hypothetical protein